MLLTLEAARRPLRRRRRARRASTSRSPTARSCACSGRAAAARPRCCGPSPGSSRRRAGRVSLDGADLHGVPPHRRGFGLMFQDHALFPHRDVRRQRRLRAAHARRAARETTAASPGAARRWSGWPGSEHRRGRRALGRRAAARRPRPRARARAAAADARRAARRARPRAARAARRRAARALRPARHSRSLFVTHDQDEAFALADRVAVMHDGRIEQVGTAARGLAAAGQRRSSPASSATTSRARSAAAAVRGAARVAASRIRKRPIAGVPSRARTFRRDHFLLEVEGRRRAVLGSGGHRRSHPGDRGSRPPRPRPRRDVPLTAWPVILPRRSAPNLHTSGTTPTDGLLTLDPRCPPWLPPPPHHPRGRGRGVDRRRRWPPGSGARASSSTIAADGPPASSAAGRSSPTSWSST